MNADFPSSIDNPPNSNYNRNPNYSYFTQQAIRAGYIADEVKRREFSDFATGGAARHHQFEGFAAGGDVRRPKFDSYATGGEVCRRQFDGFVTNADVSHRQLDGFATNGDATRREYTYTRNFPVDDMYSSQREMEKERIRKEIIAEEMMRRKVLEEEVRREMMLDRDSPLYRGEVGIGGSRGGTMKVKLWGGPSLANYEHRKVEYGDEFPTIPPFERPVVAGRRTGVTLREITEEDHGFAMPEVYRDKSIIVAKPHAHFPDLKRKTMTPPVRGAIEVFKKQKTKEGWTCDICQIIATSERGLNDHLRGKKHQAFASGTVVTHRMGFGTEPVPKMFSSNTVKPLNVLGVSSTPSVKKNNFPLLKSKGTSVGNKGNGKAKVKAKALASVDIKKKFPHFCEICQVAAKSMIVFDAHMKGKKHLANLSGLNKTKDSALIEPSTEKAMTEEKVPKKTSVGKRGNRKVKVPEETSLGKRGNKKVKLPPIGKPKQNLRFFCDICQVGANSMMVFNAHKKGKKHSAKLSELNKSDDIALVEASTEKSLTEENKVAAVEENIEGDVSVDTDSEVEDEKELTKENEVLVAQENSDDDVSVDMDLEEGGDVSKVEDAVTETALEVDGGEKLATNTTDQISACNEIGGDELKVSSSTLYSLHATR